MLFLGLLQSKPKLQELSDPETSLAEWKHSLDDNSKTKAVNILQAQQFFSNLIFRILCLDTYFPCPLACPVKQYFENSS